MAGAHADQERPVAVFHVISSTSVGGAEMMLERFLSHHASARHTMVISMTTAGAVGRRLQGLGIPVVSLDMRSLAGVGRGLWKYFRLLRKHRPACVVAWMYHANLLVSLYGRFSGATRIVWNIRCGLSDYCAWPLMRKIIFWCCRFVSGGPRFIVYNSIKSMRQHVAQGFPVRNGTVVYNGFDALGFTRVKNVFLRAELGIPADAFLVGSFGRNFPVKRMADLLQVAVKLLPRDCPVQLLYVGRNFDTAEFRDAIRRSGLATLVHVVPEVPSLIPYYGILDAFCLCSEAEGFPNVVGEAVYSGVPVFCSDVSDLKEVFLEGWQISPVGDIEGLASSAYRIFRMGQQERNILAERQKSAYLQRTDIDTVVSTLADAFWGSR
ncbi:MAG: glycosyltransferase [Desulfobulbaceae bacterium]|nr:glycosyltransferase [Desulfobulbaceae bacterium]